MLVDDDINALRQRQHILLRQQSRGEITQAQLDEELSPLETEIDSRLQKVFEENDKRVRRELEKERIRRETMAEEVKKKEKVPRASSPRGPKKNSYASVILEKLQKRSLKTVDVVTDAVLEEKPGRDRAKVKSQINVMLNEIKKGKKPQFVMDADGFHISPKA